MTPGEAAYRKRREIHGFALSWEDLSAKTRREWEEIALAAIEAQAEMTRKCQACNNNVDAVM